MQERQKRHQGTQTSEYTVSWCIGWSLQGGSERSRGHHSAALTQQKFLQNRGVGADSEKGRKVKKDPLFPEFSWTDVSIFGHKLSTAATFTQRGALKQKLWAAGINTCVENEGGKLGERGWTEVT